MENKDLLTIQEAASLLGVTTATLRNWDRKGKLRAVRHPANDYRLFRVKDVAALQKQHQLFPTDDKDAEPDPPPLLNSAELRRLVKRLHRILRDREGNSSLIERFDELTKLLYLKVHDERAPDRKNGVQPFAMGSQDSDSEIAARVSLAFEQHVKRSPELFPSRFKKIRLGTEALREVVEALEPVDLLATSEDLKGLAYEEVIRNTFDKGDNQQFFTPRSLVEFMVSMVEDALSGTICDPACGTGGFLLQVSNVLQDRGKRPGVRLLGIEVDERLKWVAGINLDMHEVENFAVEHLEAAGSLGEGVIDHLGTIDTILTNPPFGSDFTDANALNQLELGKGRASRRRGVLFIERCLDLLKPGGVLAIIIDDGVLNAPSNCDARELILQRSHPVAVVSLPETAFMPYATVKASILFLQKKGGTKRRLGHGGQVLFSEAEVVGRKPNGDPLLRVSKSTGKLEPDSDLPKILEAWKSAPTAKQTNTSSFWSEIPRLTDEAYRSDGYRLDAAYHHPSRHQAIHALQSSPYPLFSLAQVCGIRADSVIPSRQMPDEEITYVGLANIEARTGGFSPSIVSGVSLKSAVKRFYGGDILYAKMRPELRKVCLVPDELAEGFASAECIVLTPNISPDTKRPHILPELLELLLRSDLVYGQIVHLVMGIGRPRLNKEHVLNVRIPVPQHDEQRRLLDLYQRSMNASRALLEESDKSRVMAESIASDAGRQLLVDMLSTNRTSTARRA